MIRRLLGLKTWKAAALALSAVVFCAAAQGAQNESKTTTPDFRGSWVAVKPPKLNEHVGVLVRLEVVHAEPELKVTRVWATKGRERKDETVYYTDGRGEVNLWEKLLGWPTTPSGGEELKTKTVWKGEKLISKTDVDSMPEKNRRNMRRFKEEWKLSKDGSELNISMKLEIILDGEQALRLGTLPSGEPYRVSLDPIESKYVLRRAPR